MKKILLLAASVLVCTSAAQAAPAKDASHAVSRKAPVSKSAQVKAPESLLMTLSESSRKDESFKTLSAESFVSSEKEVVAAQSASLSAAVQTAKLSKAEAPVGLEKLYSATGRYADGGKLYSTGWVMEYATDGTNDYFFDVIPDIQNWTGGEGIAVPFTMANDTIVIDPAYIGKVGNYHVHLFNYTSAKNGGDGAIRLVLGEDGSIKNPASSDIYMYGAFSSDTYDYVGGNKGSYLGYLVYLTSAAYTPYPKFEVETVYTGYGKDKQESAIINWDMATATKDGKKVLVDVLPEINEGTPLFAEYSQTGSTVTIPAQIVGTWSSYYVMLINLSSYYAGGDGSIKFFLDENGNMPSTGDTICYYAVTANVADMSYAAGYLTWEENVSFYKEGFEPPALAPKVEYVPENVNLFASYGADNYGYPSYQIVAPYSNLSFLNVTTDPAESWSWSADALSYNGNGYDVESTQKGSDRNFVMQTEDGMYMSPTLIGTNNGEDSAPYIWGYSEEDNFKGYMEAGSTSSSFYSSNDVAPFMTAANPVFSRVRYSNFETGQGYDKMLAYQGKPAAPLFCSGVSLSVYGFEFVEDQEFNLNCYIVKCQRDGSRFAWGDTLYVGTASADGVEIFSEESVVAIIHFTFSAEDADGMETELDHIFIEDEFAVIIDGWENGTFKANAFHEYHTNENGAGYSAYYKPSEDRWVYFAGNDRIYVGFDDAAYGYLQVEGNTNIEAPAEGNETVLKVNPMLYSTSSEDGSAAVRLFVENADNMPDWIALDWDDSNYEGGEFELSVIVEPNEDSESRSYTFRAFQEGAYFDVTVSQAGVSTGIEELKAVEAAPAKLFNIYGQPASEADAFVVGKNFKAVVR